LLGERYASIDWYIAAVEGDIVGVRYSAENLEERSEFAVVAKGDTRTKHDSENSALRIDVARRAETGAGAAELE
jgi:hypothetical protein